MSGMYSAYFPVELRAFKDGIDFAGDVALTVQSEARDCDINEIMKRYEKTGLLPHLNRFEGVYGDVGPSVDYHEAMNIVVKAQEMFMELPAQLRARFGNDPGEFMKFVQDPENAEEMVKLGIAEVREPEKPVEVVVKEMPAAPEDGEKK